MSLRSRGLVALAALAVSLLAAVAARAETVVRQDAAGRTITFDVLSPVADVDWYAGILSAAAHGDEISRVTVRIVPAPEITARCGADAIACYVRRRGVSTITVPAGKSDALASTLLHEYGHHLDANRAVDGVSELNGTPVWWATRGIASLLAAGAVAFDYSLGWERSIGELFAEDYAYIHAHIHRDTWYSIPWIAPPDAALQAAMLAELGAVRPESPAQPPAVPPTPVAPPTQTGPKPVTSTVSGVLAPRGRASIPFELLGAGRRVTATASVPASLHGRTTARLEIVCGGTVVRRAAIRRTATLDVPGLGPAVCRAAVVNTSPSRQRYSLQLKLSLAA